MSRSAVTARCAPANSASSGASCLPMIRTLSHSPGCASARDALISRACSRKRSRLPQTKKISSSFSLQVPAQRFALDRELHEVGGLVVQAVGHVEVGFRERIARLDADGPSPDSVSSTAPGRRLGSACARCRRSLGRSGWLDRTALLDEDVGIARTAAVASAGTQVGRRAGQRFLQVDFRRTGSARGCACRTGIAERGGKQAEQQPPVLAEPLEQGRRSGGLGSTLCGALPPACLGRRRRSRLDWRRGSLRDGRASAPVRRRLGSGRRLAPEAAPGGVDRTGCAVARLGLQRGEFGVAHLEQAPGLGQLGLELLHARLQLAGSPRPAQPRRPAPRRGGRSAAGVPCSGVTSRSRPLAASGPPLPAPLRATCGTGATTSAAAADAEIADTSDALGIFEQAAGPQDVDVAVERLRIRLVDRHHGPIHVGARSRGTPHSRSSTACRSGARDRSSRR